MATVVRVIRNRPVLTIFWTLLFVGPISFQGGTSCTDIQKGIVRYETCLFDACGGCRTCRPERLLHAGWPVWNRFDQRQLRHVPGKLRQLRHGLRHDLRHGMRYARWRCLCEHLWWPVPRTRRTGLRDVDRRRSGLQPLPADFGSWKWPRPLLPAQLLHAGTSERLDHVSVLHHSRTARLPGSESPNDWSVGRFGLR